MVDFTRDVQGSNFSPTIIQPVEDRSTAQAITTAGSITHELMAGAARRGFRGEEGGVDEVAPDPTLVQEGVPFKPVEQQVGDLDTLSKIAAARKAGLRGDVAQARAEVAFRKALADNPLFQDEIRQTYGTFFKSQLGKTGFFVDPKIEKTPQEIAFDKYQEEVALGALRTGLTVDQYTAQAQETARYQQTAAQIEVKQQISDSDLGAYGAALTNEAALSIQQQAVLMMKENRGQLSPEQVSDLRAQALLASTQLERQWEQLAADKGLAVSTAARTELRRQTQNLNNVIETLTGDVGSAQIMADKATELSDMIRFRAMTASPEIFSLKTIYGEQGLSTLMSMADSKDFANFKSNNPFVRNMIQLVGPESEFAKRLAYQGIAYLSDEVEAENADPLTLQAAAVNMKNADVMTKAPIEKVRKIMSESPAAMIFFDQPNWRAEVDKGYPVKNIESYIKAALMKETGRYTSANNKVLTDLQVIPRSNQVMQQGQLVDLSPVSSQVVDQDGESVSGSFASRIRDAVRVTKRYPELWEGFFESPEEYVKSLIVPEQPKTEEPETKEEEKAPEVSLSEEEINSLKVAEAMKISDLDESEIRSILGVA